MKLSNMENNTKRRKDELNASASSRSSRASSSTVTNVTSRALESLEGSLSSLSQSEVVYNSQLVSSNEQDVLGGYDLRAHLQQIMQVSDDMESSSDDDSLESFEDDDGADAELQRIVGRGQGEGRGDVTPKPTNQSSNALVPVEEAEEEDLDSDEENEIMREIKAEITNNVRQEMNSELEVYKTKMESLEKGAAEGKGTDDKGNEDLEHLEPKLRDAFIKMRKLDKVLAKRVRREKEVKRDRILLERRIRQELKDLHSEGKQEYKEIATNEQKFLSLELPSRHNEDDICHEPICNDTGCKFESEFTKIPINPSINNQHNAELQVSTHGSDSDEKKFADHLPDVVKTNAYKFDRVYKVETNESELAESEKEHTDENVISDVNDNDKDKECRSNVARNHNKGSEIKLTSTGRNHYYKVDDEDYSNDFANTDGKNDSVTISMMHNVLIGNWLQDNFKDNAADNETGIAKEATSNSVTSRGNDLGPLTPDKLVPHPPVLECWKSDSENKGVIVPDEITGEPVFATQLNEEEYPIFNKNMSSRQGTRDNRAESKATTNTGKGEGASVQDDTSSVASGSMEGRKHKKKRKKDFIKRNKELASDAANVIAMTEEEKHRLDDLLKDVDNIPELPDNLENVEDENNPFQIAIHPGEGFHPDQEELRSLTSIDAQLKEILPLEDYESIASSSLSHAPKHKLFTRTAARSDIEWENHGDRALFQNAEQRDMNDRLRAIEEELAKLHNPDEIEIETPRLDDDQLHDLIDQCVTSLSRVSMSRTSLHSDSRFSFADTESITGGNQSVDDNTPRTPNSVRQEILENPPRLAPEVLQKLLSEAYHPLSKQLSTLKEEDYEDEDGTPIPADVWKLISMEKVEESPELPGTNEADDRQNIQSRNNGLNDFGNSGSRQNSFDNLQNFSSARNVMRTLSRDSSSSSLNGANTDNSRDVKPLKLPEIDPSGTLVTQGQNNQRFPCNSQRPGSSGSVKTPINMVRNSFSDSKIDNNQSSSRLEIMSLDGDYMSPRPPSVEKRETGSASKSRILTLASRPVT